MGSQPPFQLIVTLKTDPIRADAIHSRSRLMPGQQTGMKKATFRTEGGLRFSRIFSGPRSQRGQGWVNDQALVLPDSKPSWKISPVGAPQSAKRKEAMRVDQDEAPFHSPV